MVTRLYSRPSGLPTVSTQVLFGPETQRGSGFEALPANGMKHWVAYGFRPFGQRKPAGKFLATWTRVQEPEQGTDGYRSAVFWVTSSGMRSERRPQCRRRNLLRGREVFECLADASVSALSVGFPELSSGGGTAVSGADAVGANRIVVREIGGPTRSSSRSWAQLGRPSCRTGSTSARRPPERSTVCRCRPRSQRSCSAG